MSGYIHSDDDDEVRATRESTWVCLACGKRTRGFVVPFGRCYLCGGALKVVDSPPPGDAATARLVREAFALELEMATFYELAVERVTDPQVRDVLQELALKERDHVEELEHTYGIRAPAELSEPRVRRFFSEALFEGMEGKTGEEQARELYDRAIALETRTRDHFLQRATESTGPERELYRAFAAEEDDHIAMLQTERQQL
mgnify:CR=1 FL=1